MKFVNDSINIVRYHPKMRRLALGLRAWSPGTYAQDGLLSVHSHDFMHDLVHLLSFEVAAVCCCCPKASPVIPTTAMVKKIFFIIIKVFNGLKCKGKQSFPEELNFYYFCPALVSPNGG